MTGLRDNTSTFRSEPASSRLDAILRDYERQQARTGRFPDILVIGPNVERELFQECRHLMNPGEMVSPNHEYRGVKLIVSRYLRPDDIWCPPAI